MKPSRWVRHAPVNLFERVGRHPVPRPVRHRLARVHGGVRRFLRSDRPYGIDMPDRVDAIRCDAPLRLPLSSAASPCHAPRRRSASRRGSPPFRSTGPASLRGRAVGVPPLRPGRPSTPPPGRPSTPPPGRPSTSPHRCEDSRKTADLRRRSPPADGEFQQKCDVMGTVALHRGFPLMRMIFFDKTPPRDPCLWGEVE